MPNLKSKPGLAGSRSVMTLIYKNLQFNAIVDSFTVIILYDLVY